jgi:hypothetical protein
LERIGHAPPRQLHGIADDADEEERLLVAIRKETRVWNLNNVTRTQAYWNVYRSHPELHWALLAHMVSRNGGWSMTDLRGEWLPRLLKPETAEQLFTLLEACNAQIFQDAYPQLRLYVESRKRNRPLFALLPGFGVSAFMGPFWERFWLERNSVALTTALILNEQNVIQTTVLERSPHQERAEESLLFQTAPWLRTNQVVFPLLSDRRNPGPLTLVGGVLERFASLDERIRFGKSLYAMLFGYPRVLSGVRAFAERIPHTGSRADYWPSVFRDKQTSGIPREGDPASESRWYSPRLEKAWPDRPPPEPPDRDWFQGEEVRTKMADWLVSPKPPRAIDMTEEHQLGQRKLQAMAAAPLPRI